MNRLLFFLTVFVLTACSSIDRSRIAPGYAEAFKTFRTAFFGYEDNQISSSVINNIPYASSLLKIGKGPTGLLILESKNDDTETWISADKVILLIRNGKIIRSSGLQNNLVNLISPYDSFKDINFKSSSSFKIYLSYDKPSLFNLPIEVNLKFKGPEKITLFNREIELMLIEEELVNTELGWRRVNKYWVDQDYFVWKSEQYISPKLPKFSLEVTKKPS